MSNKAISDETIVNRDELVDIRTISVDKNLPKKERIAEYIRQIKDPYHFRCGDCAITVEFDEKGPTLEDCLARLIALNRGMASTFPSGAYKTPMGKKLSDK